MFHGGGWSTLVTLVVKSKWKPHRPQFLVDKYWLTYNCGEDKHADEVTDDGKHVPETDQGNTSWILFNFLSSNMQKKYLFKKEKNRIKKKENRQNIYTCTWLSCPRYCKETQSRCFSHQKVTQGCNIARNLMHSKGASLVKEAHIKNQQWNNLQKNSEDSGVKLKE